MPAQPTNKPSSAQWQNITIIIIHFEKSKRASSETKLLTFSMKCERFSCQDVHWTQAIAVHLICSAYELRCVVNTLRFSFHWLSLSPSSSYGPHLHEISLNDFTWTINVRWTFTLNDRNGVDKVILNFKLNCFRWSWNSIVSITLPKKAHENCSHRVKSIQMNFHAEKSINGYENGTEPRHWPIVSVS